MAKLLQIEVSDDLHGKLKGAAASAGESMKKFLTPALIALVKPATAKTKRGRGK